MLADFSDGQIRRFVRRWYARRGEDAADNAGRARLLEQAIFRREGGRLTDLARRPLLLTLMAYLHARSSGRCRTSATSPATSTSSRAS